MHDDLAARDQRHNDMAVDARAAVERPRRNQHVVRGYTEGFGSKLGSPHKELLRAIINRRRAGGPGARHTNHAFVAKYSGLYKTGSFGPEHYAALRVAPDANFHRSAKPARPRQKLFATHGAQRLAVGHQLRDPTRRQDRQDNHSKSGGRVKRHVELGRRRHTKDDWVAGLGAARLKMRRSRVGFLE